MYYYLFWIDNEGNVESVDGPMTERQANWKGAIKEFDEPELYPHIHSSFSSDPMVALKEWIGESLGGVSENFYG